MFLLKKPTSVRVGQARSETGLLIGLLSESLRAEGAKEISKSTDDFTISIDLDGQCKNIIPIHTRRGTLLARC